MKRHENVDPGRTWRVAQRWLKSCSKNCFGDAAVTSRNPEDYPVISRACYPLPSVISVPSDDGAGWSVPSRWGAGNLTCQIQQASKVAKLLTLRS